MEKCKKAKRGRSKEKRRDAKLIVLALAISPDGFIKYSAILEGNNSDVKSLPDMVDKLASLTGETVDKPLVVIDAGISSEGNLELLVSKGYDYLCVSRSKPKDSTAESKGKSVTVYDTNKSPITLTALKDKAKDGATYLMVNSKMKEVKERSMNSLFKERFDDSFYNYEDEFDKLWRSLGQQAFQSLISDLPDSNNIKKSKRTKKKSKQVTITFI